MIHHVTTGLAKDFNVICISQGLSEATVGKDGNEVCCLAPLEDFLTLTASDIIKQSNTK